MLIIFFCIANRLVGCGSCVWIGGVSKDVFLDTSRNGRVNGQDCARLFEWQRHGRFVFLLLCDLFSSFKIELYLKRRSVIEAAYLI